MSDKNVTLISEQVNEANSPLAGSAMTKAGRLAMELSHEKRSKVNKFGFRIHGYDEINPTTPSGTIYWFVKWISLLFAVAGVFLISASFLLYGQLAYLISTVGWIYVGMQWGDRAIMIGSAISGTAIAMNIVNSLV